MRVCIILLAIIASGFRFPSVEVELTGHLRSKSHQNVGSLTIFVKGPIENGLVRGLVKTTTDKNGNFNMHFDACESCKEPLLFYYVGKTKDTIFLKRVITLESDTPETTFWIK